MREIKIKNPPPAESAAQRLGKKSLGTTAQEKAKGPLGSGVEPTKKINTPVKKGPVTKTSGGTTTGYAKETMDMAGSKYDPAGKYKKVVKKTTTTPTTTSKTTTATTPVSKPTRYEKQEIKTYKKYKEAQAAGKGKKTERLYGKLVKKQTKSIKAGVNVDYSKIK
jgi:hypothetical protein